ncbi:hypothetical protein [Pectobacterium aroidearum]|uniref:hypothetical protein n=1 Tax=Pectobacterium aroidearum TaxID=1201031 RepID=UPI0032ECE7FB
MKPVLYWSVKLFQHLPSSLLASGVTKKMLLDGYAKEKPSFRPGAEFTIELMTNPHGLEMQTIRTCGVDSMTCTPVYESSEEGTEWKPHDHACVNCYTGKGECLGECNVYDENKSLAAGVMQDYFPEGGKDWDHILSLYDAIAAGKIPGVQAVQLNPSRAEMTEYIKTAIGEGYQPEHQPAVSDLAVIDALADHDLNREFGKCWQWYNMGGGLHETVENKLSFEDVARSLIKWLAESVHPHHSVIVDSTHAELLEGQRVVSTKEYLRD